MISGGPAWWRALGSIHGCAQDSGCSGQRCCSRVARTRSRRRRLRPAPPPRVKLAVLPVESDAFPRAAEALNAQMRDVKVQGVDDYFLSKVTLEVVQLSIECVKKLVERVLRGGGPFAVGRAAPARAAPAGAGWAPPPRSRHHRRKKTIARPVRVTITLFDVGAGEATHVADRTFKSDGEAAVGIEALLQEAIGLAPAGSARSATP